MQRGRLVVVRRVEQERRHELPEHDESVRVRVRDRVRVRVRAKG